MGPITGEDNKEENDVDRAGTGRNHEMESTTGVYRMRKSGEDENNGKGRNETRPKRGERNEKKQKGEEVEGGREKKAEGEGSEENEGRRAAGTERGRVRERTRHVREIREWFEMRIRDETESPVWERGRGSPPPPQHQIRPKR